MPNLSAAALLRELTEPKEPHKAGRQRFRQAAVELIAQEKLLAPAFSFQIVDLDMPAADTLQAGGERLYAPRLLPASGKLTALACGVATIGPRLEQRVGTLFKERHPSLALALDAIGNELLFAAVRCLQDRIMVAARQRGLTMAGELRPGDPGLALDTQGAVLRLAEAETIGVRVTQGQAIHPLKSSSQVLGVGTDLPPAHWSRCDDCRMRATCKLAARETEMAAN
jgi:hypothetical protein